MIQDRILKLEKVDWRNIQPLQPDNIKHVFNFQHIEDSIRKNGFAFPFGVWECDGVIYAVDGHTRKEVLSNMEDAPDLLPAFFINAKDRKEAVKILLDVFNQRQNPVDQEVLLQWLDVEEIKVEEVAVESLNMREGSEEEEIHLEAEEDDYEEPSNMKVDVVLGDLITFEKDGAELHRVLCGDSTDSDAVARVMNGEKADMVFTDPPYGINHSGKGIKGEADENDFGEILGDNDVSIAIDNFNLISNLYPSSTLIYWGANYYSQCIPNGFGWLFWDKEREGDTFSGGEVAFVNKGVRFDVFRHRWHGMIKASEVGEKRVHPTQKPVALCVWCFDNYNAGNIIADFFLGSHSTMVAAHQLNRKCYGLELEPKYCQVGIDRMHKLDPDLVIKINGKEYTPQINE